MCDHVWVLDQSDGVDYYCSEGCGAGLANGAEGVVVVDRETGEILADE